MPAVARGSHWIFGDTACKCVFACSRCLSVAAAASSRQYSSCTGLLQSLYQRLAALGACMLHVHAGSTSTLQYGAYREREREREIEALLLLQLLLVTVLLHAMHARGRIYIYSSRTYSAYGGRRSLVTVRCMYACARLERERLQLSRCCCCCCCLAVCNCSSSRQYVALVLAL